VIVADTDVLIDDALAGVNSERVQLELRRRGLAVAAVSAYELWRGARTKQARAQVGELVSMLRSSPSTPVRPSSPARPIASSPARGPSSARRTCTSRGSASPWVRHSSRATVASFSGYAGSGSPDRDAEPLGARCACSRPGPSPLTRHGPLLPLPVLRALPSRVEVVVFIRGPREGRAPVPAHERSAGGSASAAAAHERCRPLR